MVDHYILTAYFDVIRGDDGSLVCRDQATWTSQYRVPGKELAKEAKLHIDSNRLATWFRITRVTIIEVRHVVLHDLPC